MEEIIDTGLKIILIFDAIMIFACFIRACKGPTIPDRLVAVNMISTHIIIMIAVLTVLLKEIWLTDVALVYALISFIGVVVLTKIYIGIYRKRLALKLEENMQQETSAEQKKKRKGHK